MPSRRLLALVTILTCLGGAAGAQTPFSIDQLREIEGLVISRNCAGLRFFIAANPELVRGGDPLSVELRNFAAGVDQGLIDCLSLSEADAGAAGAAVVNRNEQAY